jgi:hypothetical protein
MKILFDNKSYIHAYRDPDVKDRIVIMISAKDNDNPLKLNVNSAMLTVEQFKALIADLV